MLPCFQRVRGQKRFFPARKVTQTLPRCYLTQGTIARQIILKSGECGVYGNIRE